MILECPECGTVKNSKNWQDCGNKHPAVGMYQVIDWGKAGAPKIDVISPIENKWFPEEKNPKSTIPDEIMARTIIGAVEKINIVKKPGKEYWSAS